MGVEVHSFFMNLSCIFDIVSLIEFYFRLETFLLGWSPRSCICKLALIRKLFLGRWDAALPPLSHSWLTLGGLW